MQGGEGGQEGQLGDGGVQHGEPAVFFMKMQARFPNSRDGRGQTIPNSCDLLNLKQLFSKENDLNCLGRKKSHCKP